MPEPAVDEVARRLYADLRDAQFRLDGRINTHEAVCEHERAQAMEWRKSAIVILEDIKAANAIAHDQMRRDLKEFMASQAATNADFYGRIGHIEVNAASERGKIVGASGVIAAIVTVLVSLISSLVGWPRH